MKFLKYFVFIIVLISELNTGLAANITANIDRNPVIYGESFILNITVTGSIRDKPDFSVLNKDFTIRGKSQSTRFNFINGQSEQSIQWEITLFPKRIGQLTIPEISIGNDKTSSINLVVNNSPKPSQTGQQSQDIFIEAEITPKTAYVQQQLMYTQRLFHDRQLTNVQITPVSLSEGKADMMLLGEPIRKTMQRNGKKYQVIERRYIIFPNKSGKLVFTPIILNAILPDPQQAGGFFNFSNGKHIRRYSKSIEVNIQPQEKTYQGKHWLPANNITLNLNWSVPKTQVKAGEPVTLTLETVAHGLKAEQLPNIELAVPQNIKTYSDKANLTNQYDEQGIIGTRWEKIVLIAEENGTYTLPKIKLDWWDLVNNQLKTASIPAAEFKVSGGIVKKATPPVNSTPKTKVIEEPPKKQPELKPQIEKTETQPTPETHNFWLYTTIILFIIWLITLLFWFRHKGNKKIYQPTLKIENPFIRQKLKQACLANNAKETRKYLLQWGEKYLSLQSISLEIIAEKTNPQIKAEINHLNHYLYAENKQNWQGKKLWLAIKQYKINHHVKKEKSALQPLNPME